ncbi:MAG: hypothetical protein ACE5H2_10280 [Terriglobia bacterium]
MDDESPTSLIKPRWLSSVLYVGPVLLFLAATAYGILEVHSSTDTWIGLAAGRQILTADEFPTTDTFSYTVYGNVWYNQNWLTHLFQYWLYSRISPNAVIYGTWMMSASVFTLVLLAAYWRSGTWLGALLAASVVGLGCRDFLSARPATTGFFCLAGLWALLCALEGQGDRRRGWPIVLLLPLLLFWGNAHGSFVFGYGVLGLYVGHWFVVRTIRVKHSWLFSLALPLALLLVAGALYSVLPEGASTRMNNVLDLGAVAYSKKKLALAGGALLAYAAYWTCTRRFRPRVAIRDAQVAAIGGVAVAALLLTAVFGPFGIDNFTHGQKVAGSEVFRQVSEWHPPTDPGKHFPPVWRFWTILGASLGMLLSGSLLWLYSRTTTRPAPAHDRPHTSLFDLTVVVIGLSMTLWARRFAPIYFIFGAPVFLTWIVLLLRALAAPLRQHLRLGVVAGAWLLAAAAAVEAGTKAHDEIVRRFEPQPQFNLLERVTRYDLTPHNGILFLKENELNVNLLVEWTQAGPVMFHARNARVFMDGRAQQVYDERHYEKYSALLGILNTPRRFLMRILAEHDTDAVLLRRTRKAENLWIALDQSREWVPVLLGVNYGLFLHKDSRGLAQLGELLRRGEEWRPNTGPALAARGLVWQATTPPDLEQALACWQAALRQNVLTGSLSFRRITTALLELGRHQEARQFVEKYFRELNRPIDGVSDESRRRLLRILKSCWDDIETATAASPTDDAED